MVRDAIAVLSNGPLYGFPRNTADLDSINPATGLATGGGSDSLTSDGTNLYLTYEMGGDPASLYLLDTSTGNAVQEGSSGGPQFEGSGFLGGMLYAFGTDNQIYTVNNGTGAATLIAPLSASLSGVNAAAPAYTPEPSTFLLLSLGAVVILCLKRRS